MRYFKFNSISDSDTWFIEYKAARERDIPKYLGNDIKKRDQTKEHNTWYLPTYLGSQRGKHGTGRGEGKGIDNGKESQVKSRKEN